MSERQLIYKLFKLLEQASNKPGGGSASLPVANLFQAFDSVAAIRAMANPVGIVWIKGGSPYLWDDISTDADDGISVIKLDSVATGRYLQQSI